MVVTSSSPAAMRPKNAAAEISAASCPYVQPVSGPAGEQAGEHRRVVQQQRRGGCLQRPDDGDRQQQPGG